MPNLEMGIMRFNKQEVKKNQELIDWAMSHGVNHFESCWFYLNYDCEKVLYSLLEKYNRTDYYICGKMPIHGIVYYQDFKEIFKTQIERVPGHYFDTYLLQALDERAILDLRENNIIEYFLKKKKEGIIKRFGLSIQCRPDVFKMLLDLKCWDVVQMPINYYDWYLCRYDENYRLACEYGLPIIAQAPVKGGLLTKEEKFSSEFFSSYNRNNLESAYDFIQNLPNIELILTGNSKLETFEKAYNAFSSYKKPNSLENFKLAIKNYKEKSKINCLECGRCDLVCNQHLPISAYIKLYNLALNDKNYFNALDIIKISTNEPSHRCNSCKECIRECPLGVDIPNLFYTTIWELRT